MYEFIRRNPQRIVQMQRPGPADLWVTFVVVNLSGQYQQIVELEPQNRNTVMLRLFHNTFLRYNWPF